ncbi:MAG: ABC transporter ATP-binding protein, partial [Gammaproteobacteria bacterium]
GSGKSTTALAAAKLVPARSGRVEIDGTDILALEGEALRQQRRNVQFIFQDPYSSLNPRLRAGEIVREPLDRLNVDSRAERAQRVSALFRDVGLRPEQERLFPHQFSGGQRQRLGIARALASRPKLVICDEPVSALDVAVQAQILNLLRRLQREHDLTYLFISHDLGVVQHMCNEVAVMYTGRIVEQASRVRLFTDPLHPYTKALLSSVPSADPARDTRANRILITGDPPSPIDPASGCRFASRCPIATEHCRKETPELIDREPGHRVACHRVGEPIAVRPAQSA